jgi:hypothetical protein
VAEFYGLEAIAERLGVSVPTVKKWHAERGLILYLRNRPAGSPPRTRPCWYTNDQLILAWELSVSKLDRARVSIPGRTSERVGRGR